VIVLVAKYHVQPGQIDAVLGHLNEMKPLVEANEPGCRFYQVSRATESDDLVLLYEHYSDAAALEAHRSTAHFQEIIEGRVLPLLVERERELFELVIG
jgi:autoinducer 2-degrading protein